MLESIINKLSRGLNKGAMLALGTLVGGLSMFGISNKADALQLEIYTEQWTDRGGVTLLPDGSSIQFIWAGQNGRIDDPLNVLGPIWTPAWSAWVAAGCPPLGDDQLISSNPEWPSYGAPAEQGTLMGYAWTGNYLSDPYPEPPDASTYLDPANNITGAQPFVYVRVFEAKAFGSWWGNSQLGWVDVGSPVPFTVSLPGGQQIPEPSLLELLATAVGVGLFYRRLRRKEEKT